VSERGPHIRLDLGELEGALLPHVMFYVLISTALNLTLTSYLTAARTTRGLHHVVKQIIILSPNFSLNQK